MVIYLFFDSSQRFMDNSMVSSIVLPNLSDESNQYKETPTDNRNHNLSSHVILLSVLVKVELGRKNHLCLGRT